MKADALQLAETDDLTAWDAWVEQSPQGTVFCKSTFLQSLNARFRLFAVMANTQVVALLPLLELLESRLQSGLPLARLREFHDKGGGG